MSLLDRLKRFRARLSAETVTTKTTRFAVPDLDWVDDYVQDTFDRAHRFSKRMSEEFEKGEIRQGSTVHVHVAGQRGGKTEAQRQAVQGFLLAPDAKAALVASRDVLMAGTCGGAARGQALDQINAVLLRAGFVWHQPMRVDRNVPAGVVAFGPAILVERKR